MKKVMTISLKAPKSRNFAAMELWQNPKFKGKAFNDGKKYSRKQKHKGKGVEQ